MIAQKKCGVRYKGFIAVCLGLRRKGATKKASAVGTIGSNATALPTPSVNGDAAIYARRLFSIVRASGSIKYERPTEQDMPGQPRSPRGKTMSGLPAAERGGI